MNLHCLAHVDQKLAFRLEFLAATLGIDRKLCLVVLGLQQANHVRLKIEFRITSFDPPDVIVNASGNAHSLDVAQFDIHSENDRENRNAAQIAFDLCLWGRTFRLSGRRNRCRRQKERKNHCLTGSERLHDHQDHHNHGNQARNLIEKAQFLAGDRALALGQRLAVAHQPAVIGAEA